MLAGPIYGFEDILVLACMFKVILCLHSIVYPQRELTTYCIHHNS